MSNLAAFVARRLLALVVIAFIIATGVFFMAHLSPVDPIRSLLGQHATVANVKQLRIEFGLNLPLEQQYLKYMGGLLHGNLGLSEGSSSLGVPVWDLIQSRLPVSLKLGAWSLFIALLVGMPIGLISALRQNSIIDHAGQSVAVVAYVIPSFVFAPLSQLIFAVNLGWLPVQGWGDGGWTGPLNMIPLGQSLPEMILPVAIFAAGLAGFFAKSFRSFMLEVLRQDYIRTARAKGLKARVVINRHAIKNTLLPLASILGPTVAYLFIGAFVIENFFAIPGIGVFTTLSVENSDYSVIEGTTLLLVLAVVLINMLTDISYAVVDPRVRL